MSWVADTSWLYAMADELDSHHRSALSEARHPEPVEIPPIIMAETLLLVQYRRGKAAAEAALREIEKLPHFVLGQGTSHPEIVKIWRANAHLSYPDAAAVAAAWVKRFGLRSFDLRQLKALEEMGTR